MVHVFNSFVHQFELMHDTRIHKIRAASIYSMTYDTYTYNTRLEKH